MPWPLARKTTDWYIWHMYFSVYLAVTNNNLARNQEGPSVPLKFTWDNLLSITGKLFKVIRQIVPKGMLRKEAC
jgi:hypothetical protein